MSPHSRLSLRWLRLAGAALLCAPWLLCPAQTSTIAAPSLADLHAGFVNPPDSAKPMMRWWWFGPAVVKDELARELDQMHAAGVGGVELAADYPLTLDDPAHNLRNLRYASPEYVDMVHFAADHARALGMRVDLTLGSGWPFGGPTIPLELAAGRLRLIAVPFDVGSVSLPKLAEGDTLIAAFIAPGTVDRYDAIRAKQVPVDGIPATLTSTATTPQVALFFIASHTRQQVKRAAVGGEGYVLDHMAKPAVEHYLETTGKALLGGFPAQPPYAIFSDSLEVYGADWTPNLPAEFQRRRGYDLIPHLPELAEGGTPQADAIRHDWAQTLDDLVRENYLRPMAAYAAAHNTRFRSQTYGTPAATLADEPIPQLPEGEGPQWRAFSYTRWASSANHVYGNNITSAETWTWLHSPAFRATPLDMKAEADRMFLEGVNQIIGHGFPYSAPGVPEPGWSLYAAAALNDHNPWWPVMPYITRYLARVSYALRQGTPANDIAVLLPEDDAQAAFHPGHVSVTDEMPQHITPALTGAILDSGYNLDYIDLPAIAQRGLHYPVLVIPPTTRITLAGVHTLTDYAQSGGKAIFVGTTPTLLPGLNEAAQTPALQQAMTALLALSTHVPDDAALAAALPKALPPDLTLGDAAGKLGFMHRRLPEGDLYFIANTTPNPVQWQPRIRTARSHAEWWDPDTGLTERADLNQPASFAPYGSRIMLLSDTDIPGASMPETITDNHAQSIPLTDWTLNFLGSPGSQPAPTQQHTTDTLWTDNSATRFYSGEVRYLTHFQAKALGKSQRAELTFAPGTALPDTQPATKPGTRAWFDPPVREAAIVVLNDKVIGAVWHPPYTLDISAGLHAGENTLELRVFNTAINELASQPPRDYTALKAKYGDRFQMQDMNNLQPIPSGITGPVQITFRQSTRATAQR